MTLPTSNTVLVVETNYLIASVIEAPLVAHGYQVLIASGLEDASTLLAANAVLIAVIDFRLQHGGPGGLVSVLTSLGIPYIFCTAASAAEVREVFPSAVTLQKPFSDEDLLAAVRRGEMATTLLGRSFQNQ